MPTMTQEQPDRPSQFFRRKRKTKLAAAGAMKAKKLLKVMDHKGLVFTQPNREESL